MDELRYASSKPNPPATNNFYPQQTWNIRLEAPFDWAWVFDLRNFHQWNSFHLIFNFANALHSSINSSARFLIHFFKNQIQLWWFDGAVQFADSQDAFPLTAWSEANLPWNDGLMQFICVVSIKKPSISVLCQNNECLRSHWYFCYQSPSSNTKRCRTTVFNNLPITMYNLRNEDWLKISSKDWKIETPWCFFSLLILPKHFTARKCIFFLQYNRLLPTMHFCQQNTNNFDFNLDFWSATFGDQSGN